jgi:hypothetical protein
MRRLFILTVPLLFSMLAFSQQPPAPPSLPSKKEASDLLKKVELQTRLTTPGTSAIPTVGEAAPDVW